MPLYHLQMHPTDHTNGETRIFNQMITNLSNSMIETSILTMKPDRSFLITVGCMAYGIHNLRLIPWHIVLVKTGEDNDSCFHILE
jgi:hypothetical protein